MRHPVRHFSGDERGVVALEALISISFMLFVMVIIASVSVAIYNEAVVTSSAQLAAHSALVYNDRSSAIGAPNVAATKQIATAVAGVGLQNTVADPVTGQRPGGITEQMTLTCAFSVQDVESSSTCASTKLQARTEFLTFEIDADGTWSLPTFGSASGGDQPIAYRGLGYAYEVPESAFTTGASGG